MKLNRFHNHPHTSIHENQNEPPTSTYFGIERNYELRINETGIFTLNIDEQVVIDNFQDITFRKYLYDQFEQGALYDWLLVCWRNYQKDNGSLKEGRTITEDTINYLVKSGRSEIMLRLNKETGWCRYSTQEAPKEFSLPDLYIAIPELSIIYGGDVNRQLRDMLQQDGMEIPRTPYEVGYSIREKD